MGGETMTTMLPARFITKITVDEAGCWLWQGSTWRGYGKVWWNGTMRWALRRLRSKA
jgi:hypothetical protein